MLFLSESGSGAPTRATGAVRFLRKPVRQLRDFGASIPSVSARRNSFPSALISRQPVIVTGDRLAPGADDGTAGIGPGTAAFVVESEGVVTLSFAATEAGGFGCAGSARCVAFRAEVLFGASVDAGLVTTGRTPIGAASGAGGGGDGFAPAALSRRSCCCCGRAMSLAGHCRGTATVAITSTAAPASTTIR